MHKIEISGTPEDVDRAIAVLAAIGIKSDRVEHTAPTGLEVRRTADRLFEAWRKAAYAEEQAFADTPEEATAMVATTRAYEALITHLDDNGLAGRWWDPRGSDEEFEGGE